MYEKSDIAFSEFFLLMAIQLRDVWMAQVGTDDKSARVDVLSWLSRMTLDVIGRSGTTSNLLPCIPYP